MANHGFITTKTFLKKEKILEDLQEINNRRFKGLLKIEDSNWSNKGSWFIGFQQEGWLNPEGFNIWIRSPKKLEHRHSRTWAYYLEIVFSTELAAKYDGILSDEGHDEKWKPDVKKYPTFQSWLDSCYCNLKKNHPKSFKQMVDLEMEYCPEELKDC